jgi:hypothetical protein
MEGVLRGVSLIAIAILCTGLAQAGEPKTFLGFRLLDLENQSVKWRTPRFGESAQVTYAFATRDTTTAGARNCGRMLPPSAAYTPSRITERQFRREVAAAFRMWEAAANIAFRETADAEHADILIGAQAEPIGRAFTNVALKAGDAGKKVIGRSLICLNPRQPWKIGFDGDLKVYDLRYTLAHEIGHAIGLDHPSPSGQLMSYRYDEGQPGLRPGDIKGAALLYGPKPGAKRFAGRAAPAAAPDGRRDDADWPFGIGNNDEPARSPAH